MSRDHEIHELLVAILARVENIESLLIVTQAQEATMASSIDNLIAEVNRMTTVKDGTLALIAGLVAQVAAANAGQNPKIDAALAIFTANDDALAAANVANVPAQPAGPVVTTPPPAVTP